MNRFKVTYLCDSPWKENRIECQLYPQLFTEELMTAQIEKMRTMYPDEYQRMLMPKTLNKTYNIGMTEKFWVSVDDGNGGSKSEEITAQLLAKGNRNAIWADITQISEINNIDNDSAIEYLEFLEQKTPSTSVDSTKGRGSLLQRILATNPTLMAIILPIIFLQIFMLELLDISLQGINLMALEAIDEISFTLIAMFQRTMLKAP